MSDAAAKLEEARRAYHDAFTNRKPDLKKATSEAQVTAILRNVDAAEKAYLETALANLEKTSAAIEAAYEAAKAANDAVTAAREKAEELAEIIRAVGKAVGSVRDMVKSLKTEGSPAIPKAVN
jgi:methyl-accepting chemotaxis protein